MNEPKFEKEDLLEFIESLDDGRPGIVICIDEEFSAEFGNPIDAEILVNALYQYILMILDKSGESRRKTLEA